MKALLTGSLSLILGAQFIISTPSQAVQNPSESSSVKQGEGFSALDGLSCDCWWTTRRANGRGYRSVGRIRNARRFSPGSCRGVVYSPRGNVYLEDGGGSMGGNHTCTIGGVTLFSGNYREEISRDELRSLARRFDRKRSTRLLRAK